MMQSLSLSQLVPVLQGEIAGSNAYFHNVNTDTRTLKEGDLFVALSGPHFDAHDFVASAKEKGASAALVSRFIESDLPQLKVSSTHKALGELAAYNRAQFHGAVIAITGSSGKTTVKEMTAAILRCRGEVLATHGNLNNDIGAPLTLLTLGREHTYAVIELGASAIGEIAYTVQMTKPQVSILTNASNAHVEGFGSLAGVVQAKGEIFDGLDEQGIAIINLDDANAPVWLKRAEHKKIKTTSMHTNSGADYFSSNIHLNKVGCAGFHLHTSVGEIDIQLNFLGKHNIANALAAAAGALSVGASLYDVKFGLESLQPVKGRLNPRVGINEHCVIDDTYNANPSSMCAAIDSLAEFSGEKILVMGDMAELGSEAQEEHARIGRYAKEKGIQCLLGVGPLSRDAVNSFGQGIHCNSHDEAIASLLLISKGQTILIKGSRSAKMELVVQALLLEKDK